MLALVELSMMFSYTLPECRKLQSPQCDLSGAMQQMDLQLDTFSDIKEKKNSTISNICKKKELQSVNEYQEIRIHSQINTIQIFVSHI